MSGNYLTSASHTLLQVHVRCDAWSLTFTVMATWRINHGGLIFFNGDFITKRQFAAILGLSLSLINRAPISINECAYEDYKT